MRLWLSIAVVLLALASEASITAPTNFRTDAADFSNLALPVGAVQPQLRWLDNANNETGYQVEVSTNGTDFFLEATKLPDAEGYDSGIIPWTSNRWYRVRAVNAVEQSSYTTPIQIIGNMPSSRLGGSTDATNHMTVTWDDAGGYISGYTIQEATNETFTGTVTSYYVSGQLTESYTITNAFTLNTIYYFRVGSTNSAANASRGNSEFQNKPITYIAVAPNGPPTAPLFVDQFMDATPDESKIYFDDNSLNETGWTLEFSTNGGANWFAVAVPAEESVRHTVVVSLTGGMDYSYRLAATNTLGSSAYATWSFSPPLTPAGNPTTWYVNSWAAGNDTGTNWANAWTSLGAINWPALTAGDIVYVAGGTYTGGISTYGDGTFSSPIIIKTATNAPYNTNAVTCRSIAFRSGYVTIDGSLDASLAPSMAENITANINLRVVGNNSAEGLVATPAIAIGAVLIWAELTGAGSPISGEGAGDALIIVPETSGPTNCIFKYLWIHDNYGSAIQQSYKAAYNARNGVIFDTMLIEDIHNNYGSMAGAFTITNCYFKSWKGPGVAHPDGFQGGFYNASIVNTRIHWNCPSGSAFYPDMTGSTAMDNFYFVNNLVYGDVIEMQASLTTAGSPLVLSNWNFIGNTFYGSNTCSLSLVTSGTTNRLLKRWSVLNNLFYTGTNGSSGSGGFSSGGTSYDPADLNFNYNVVCGPSKIIAYRTNNTVFDPGVNAFANAEALNAWSSIYKSNSSVQVQLMREYLLNLTLYGGDTNALDRGTNLSSLAVELNAITNDITGAARGQAAGWDIGAYEHDTNLVLYLDFESFTNGAGSYVEDRSGRGNHAWSVTNATVTDVGNTNYAPGVVAGAVGNYAANFMLLGTNEQWQVYGSDLGYQIGNWLFITNWTGLSPMSNGTWMCWYSETNMLGTGDATLWGGGWINSPVDDNTWDVSRYNYDNLTFTEFTNSTRRAGLSVPNTSTGIWTHVTFTWNAAANSLIGYTNGVQFQSNSLSAPYLKLADNGIHNVAIGASTHGGSMTLGTGVPVVPDDQFPNNGWFNGYLDEIKIWSRNLSAAEVYAEATGGSASGGSGGGGGSEGSSGATTNFMTLDGRLNAQGVRFQ